MYLTIAGFPWSILGPRWCAFEGPCCALGVIVRSGDAVWRITTTKTKTITITQTITITKAKTITITITKTTTKTETGAETPGLRKPQAYTLEQTTKNIPNVFQLLRCKLFGLVLSQWLSYLSLWLDLRSSSRLLQRHCFPGRPRCRRWCAALTFPCCTSPLAWSPPSSALALSCTGSSGSLRLWEANFSNCAASSRSTSTLVVPRPVPPLGNLAQDLAQAQLTTGWAIHGAAYLGHRQHRQRQTLIPCESGLRCRSKSWQVLRADKMRPVWLTELPELFNSLLRHRYCNNNASVSLNDDEAAIDCLSARAFAATVF